MTDHSPAFLALVDDARKRVREVDAARFAETLTPLRDYLLIDVRELEEYEAGHLRGAIWIGKGIIERDIECRVPDKNATLYLYCGGGYRSVLVADNLQKMGYANVWSIDGGWRELEALLPTE